MNEKQQCMKNHNRRERLFVDPSVQGMLLKRVVAYWFLAIFAIALLICFQVYLAGGTLSTFFKLQQVLTQFEPALIAALCILPVIMLDCLRVTSKFAGPLVRLRREMRNLADGKSVDPVLFRKNDLYYELTDEFNRLVKYVEKLRPATGCLTDQETDVALEESAHACSRR
jgi:hypothetical protein